MTNIILGKNIRKQRLTLGWTQERLAEALCISHQIVSKWENGITSPDVVTLCSLTQIFSCSLDELCGLKPDEADEAVKNIESALLCRSGRLTSSDEELIDSCILQHPTDDRVLYAVLKLLRARHDSVETDGGREQINSVILTVAQRILDFSTDDNCRSFANYNLALYYCEQVDLRRGNELDKLNSEKAMQHANAVLYKDMHQTFWRSFGASTTEEEYRAREKTLSELIELTKRACKNLINCYNVYFSGDEKKLENRKSAEMFLDELEALSARHVF